MGTIQGYKCLRCSQSDGYCVYEPNGALSYFCGNQNCLFEDAEASKGKDVQISKTEDPDAAIKFNIGKRFVNATLAKWGLETFSISQYLKKTSGFLVIIGAPKIGKTYLSTAICNKWLQEKKDVKYCNIRQYFQHIQNQIQTDGNQYQAIKTYSQTPYLIFEDLGTSQNTDWQKEMLNVLIEDRYANQLPTVFTTPHDLFALKGLVGSSVTNKLELEENTIIKLGHEYARQS